MAKVMNSRVVLFHLREAAEELNRAVSQLEQDQSYDVEALSAALGHVYHHLNTGWNGRNQTDQEFNDSSDKSFRTFRRFPSAAEFPYLAE